MIMLFCQSYWIYLPKKIDDYGLFSSSNTCERILFMTIMLKFYFLIFFCVKLIKTKKPPNDGLYF